MNCALLWAMSIAAAVTAPVLSSLNVAQTDSAGGDTFLEATGTTLATITAVQFSRDSGATWAAGTLGALTATTARLIAPPMAASTNGLVRVVGPGGTSNALPLEFWAPTDDATCTLLYDAKHTPYNPATGTDGSWPTRYSVTGTPRFGNIIAGQNHPSDGAGGISFDGNGVGEAGLKDTVGWGAFLGAGTYAAGSAFAVHSSTTTYANTAAVYATDPYAFPSVVGNATQGTIGLDVAVIDGAHAVGAHIYGSAGYKSVSVAVPAGAALRASLIRWPAGAGTLDVSVDGGLSGSGLYNSTPVPTGHTASFNNVITLGDCYGAESPTRQLVAGKLRACGVLNAPASDAFITKFNKWKLARFGP